MLQAIERNSKIHIRSCNAVGKSYALALYIAWWLVAFDDASEPAIVLTTSTSQRQIEQSSIWHELRQIVNDSSIEFEYPKPSLTKLTMPGGSYASGFSAGADADESGVRLGGFHARGPILIVVDEASGVNPSVFRGIEGILAGGPNNKLVLLMNPLVASGFAYEAATKHRADWCSLKIGAFDTPNFSGWDLQQLLSVPADAAEDHPAFRFNPWPALVSRRWAWEMIRKHGVDNPIVQARVFGEFPSGETSQSLLSLSDIEAVAKRIPPPATNRLVAGIDVAGSDDGDSTVLCVRDGPTIVYMKSWTIADVRGEVSFELAQFRDRLESVNCDSVGIGHYFCSHLEDLGYPVQQINVASSSRHDAQGIYLNLRAELFFGNLRQRFKDGNIYSAIPWDDETIAQLSSLHWRITPGGKVQIEAKALAKARGCPSPDRADAIALAFANEGDSIDALVRYYRPELFTDGQAPNINGMKRAEPVKESFADIAGQQLRASLDGLPAAAQSRFRGRPPAPPNGGNRQQGPGDTSNLMRRYLKNHVKHGLLTQTEMEAKLREAGGEPAPKKEPPPPCGPPPPYIPQPPPPQIDGSKFLDDVEKKGCLQIPNGSAISGFQLINWIKMARSELRSGVRHPSGRPWFPGEGRP